MMKVAKLRAKFNDPTSGYIYFGGPLALVLAPTRELAIQILETSTYLACCCGLRMSLIYGGATRDSQIENLSRGVDILIATPGRLIEFVTAGYLNLSQVSYLVLDEADRMLDMGFYPQVRRLLAHTPSTRQSLLLSATWPPDIETVSREVCRNRPARVKVGESGLTINSDISQKVTIVSDSDKRKSIFKLMKDLDDGSSKILVFVRTKKTADKLAKWLSFEGYSADAIHGDKLQSVVKVYAAPRHDHRPVQTRQKKHPGCN